VNAGNGIRVDISNILLLGPNTNIQNYSIVNFLTSSGNIYPKPITATFTAADKNFDGTTRVNNLVYTLSGVISSDIITLISYIGTYMDPNIGHQTITISNITISGINTSNYILNPISSIMAYIIASALIIKLYAMSKIYDGTTSVILTPSGIISGDIVNIPSGNFNNKNVGFNKPVIVPNQLSGVDSVKYTLDVNNINADIYPKQLTAYANDKIYDTTIIATVTLSGIISGDIVDSNAYFDNKNAGINKLVNVSISDIITISGFIPINNGNFSLLAFGANTWSYIATVSGWIRAGSAGGIANGITPWSSVTPPYPQYYYQQSGSIGTKSIAQNLYLSTGNYLLLFYVNGRDFGAGIVDYSVSVSISSTILLSNYKPSVSSWTLIQLPCRLNSGYNQLVFTYTSTSTIDQSINLTGVQLISFPDFIVVNNNYQLINNITTASILQKSLGVTLTGSTKVYNASILGTVTYTISGIISGDSVDISNNYIARYNNIYVGTNKSVYVNNIISNNPNYYFTISGGYTIGTITRATIVPRFNVDKYYDKTQRTNILYTLSGVYDIDAPFITLSSNLFGLYRSIDARNNIPVDISNILLLGPNTFVQNYTVNRFTTVNSNIYPKLITATGNNKIYDRTLTATITISGTISGDYINYIARFVDYNVGINKLLNVTLSSYYIYNISATTTNLSSLTFANNYNIYTFNNSGSITFTNPVNVIALLVGGGGGGQTGTSNNPGSGGGGGQVVVANLTLNANTQYNITIGNGGARSTVGTPSGNGGTTSFASVNALGGFGATSTLITNTIYYRGGNAGNNSVINNSAYSGGAGMGDIGTTNTAGGNGIQPSINTLINSGAFYGGGGGSGGGGSRTAGFGGSGGGGAGGNATILNGGAGTPNTGGGGGGGRGNSTGSGLGGAGGSGIVIIIFRANIPIYGSNYQIALNPTANILPKQLTATFTGINKTYDATTTAQVSYTISGTISGDIVDISNCYISNFNNIYAGTFKPITINNINLTGSTYYNYSITSTNTTRGNINKLSITPIFSIDKIYDNNQNIRINDYKLYRPEYTGNLNNILLACGTGITPIIYSLNNGITWLPANNSRAIFTIVNNIIWNGMIWVAVGSGLYNIATSTDGITWTGINNTLFTNINSIAWSPLINIFVAVGSGANSIASSYDAISWSGYGTTYLTTGNDVKWNNNVCVVVGSGNTNIVYSANGINWTTISNRLNYVPTKLGWSQSLNTFIGINSNDISGTIITSSNGINWSKLIYTNHIFYNIFTNSNTVLLSSKKSYKMSLSVTGSRTVVSGLYTLFIFSDTSGSITINNYKNPLLYIFALGGGGAGGGGFGGGGGGGGFVETNTNILNDNIRISVGQGGSGLSRTNGADTTITFTNNPSKNIIAYGGGAGCAGNNTRSDMNPARSGGSGGGAGTTAGGSNFGFGTINQGNNGGSTQGGGGGASSVGLNGGSTLVSSYSPRYFYYRAGNGGSGKKISLPGIQSYYPNFYWGGGGGAGGILTTGTGYTYPNSYTVFNYNYGGNGGLGGGGGGSSSLANIITAAGSSYSMNGIGTTDTNGINTGTTAINANATATNNVYGGSGGKNTGGGGGGCAISNGGGSGGNGGSGIVVIAILTESLYYNDYTYGVFEISNNLLTPSFYENNLQSSTATIMINEQNNTRYINAGNNCILPSLRLSTLSSYVVDLTTINNFSYGGIGYTKLVDLYNIDSSLITLSSSINGLYRTKNSGNNIYVDMSGINLYGPIINTQNYSIQPFMTISSNIYKRDAILYANNKVYDGNNIATLTISGILSNENINVPIATFNNKNVGISKPVTLSGIISGFSNYNLSLSTLTANITPKTIYGLFSTTGKSYDGTTTVNNLQYTISGLINNETASLYNYVGTYQSPNRGLQLISISGTTISGIFSSNYTLAPVAPINGTISNTNIYGFINDKVYDGTLITTITLSGAIGNFTNPYGVFNDINIGSSKPVTIAGLTSINNIGYNVIVLNSTASILPKSVQAFTNDKVYDGTNIVYLTLSGVVIGDNISINATYPDKNIGINKTVTISSTLVGNNSGNYNFINRNSNFISSIFPKTLIGSFTSSGKQYDTTNNVNNLLYTITGIVNNENVSLNNYVGTYRNKFAGLQTIDISNTVLFGSDISNYILLPIQPINAQITAIPVTININDKIYDNTPIVPVQLIGAIPEDDIVPPPAIVDTMYVGTSIYVTVSGAITGSSIEGYTFNGFTVNGYRVKSFPILNIVLSIAILPRDIYLYVQDKYYDSNTIAYVSVSGVIGSDIIIPPTGVYDTKYVGNNKLVTLSGYITGTNLQNYNYVNASYLTGNILPKPLDAIFSSRGKPYDGTTTLSNVIYTIQGLVNNETVDLVSYTTTLTSPNSGYRFLTISGATLSGPYISNYVLNPVVPATVYIIGLFITANAISKVYDGNTVTTLTLSGLVGSDIVYPPIGNFETKDAGINKNVLIDNNATYGRDVGKYYLLTKLTTANITPLNITPYGNDKVYDGTVNAIITLSGIIGNDIVIQPTAIYSDRHVGTNKLITISNNISGTDGNNYILSTNTINASITPTDIYIVGNNKIYDGTLIATLTLSGILADDIVNTPFGIFDTIYVDTNKLVTISGILTGINSNNYNLYNNTVIADITPKTIYGLFTSDGKVYDNNTIVDNLLYTISGLVNNDDITLTYDSIYSNKNVGLQTININATLSGILSYNYILSNVQPINASITNRNLYINVDDKIYNNDVDCIVSLSGVLGSDIVDVPFCVFRNKDVGYNIVDISNLSGIDSYNYKLNSNIVYANILPLDIIAYGNNKIYDGSLIATITLSGILGNDTVEPLIGIFDNIYVDINKMITISGKLSGINSNNYRLSNMVTYADITPKLLYSSFSSVGKIYDGTLSVNNLEYTLSGLINNDNITLTYGGIYSDSNVGLKIISIINTSLSGILSYNYILDTVYDINATITPASLYPIGINKMYDGTLNAIISLSGILNNDDVSVDGTFLTANVETNKQIILSGGLQGINVNNYQLYNSNITSDIIPAYLVATVANKIYDGTNNADIILNGIINNDNVISPLGIYNNKNVGFNKPVTVISNISGPDAYNYILLTQTITGDIYSLLINATGVNKLYDGTTNGTVTYTGTISGDIIDYSASFLSSDVENNKQLTCYSPNNDGSPGGIDGPNYIINNIYTTANIEPIQITIVFATPYKSYDGTPKAFLVIDQIIGIANNDFLFLNSYDATFISSNIGTNIPVLVTNISLIGINIKNYTYSTSQIIYGGYIISGGNNFFIDNDLYLTQSSDLYTKSAPVASYDYILSINVGGITGINNNITNIFTSAIYSQNKTNSTQTDIELTIPDNKNVFMLFDWNEFNQQNIVSIEMGVATKAFGTFSQQPKRIGDRLLEMVAHNIFGHAQSHAAINNDSQFYNHDFKLWDHLSTSVTNKDIQNNIFKQYVTMGRYNQFNVNSSDPLQQADTMQNVIFNFQGLTFDYPLHVNGSLIFDNSLTSDQINSLYGIDTGNNILKNGKYDISVLVRFRD
jgi:hypothetical protein